MVKFNEVGASATTTTMLNFIQNKLRNSLAQNNDYLLIKTKMLSLYSSDYTNVDKKQNAILDSANFTSQNLESCFVFIKIVLETPFLVLFNRYWSHLNIEIAISYRKVP